MIAILGTCVLLPHVGKEMITSAPNEYTVSGSLQITVVKKSEEVSATDTDPHSQPLNARPDQPTGTLQLTHRHIPPT